LPNTADRVQVDTYWDSRNLKLDFHPKGGDEFIPVVGLNNLPYPLVNQSVADQGLGPSATAFLTGSALAIPPAGLRIGSTFRWKITMQKGAVGTGSIFFFVSAGILGTSSDPTPITFDLGTATADADTADVVITATVRLIGVGSQGQLQGTLALCHELQATGFSVKPNVVKTVMAASVILDAKRLILGIVVTTATGTPLTITQVLAEGRI
jgi:hypothetical protein